MARYNYDNETDPYSLEGSGIWDELAKEKKSRKKMARKNSVWSKKRYGNKGRVRKSKSDLRVTVEVAPAHFKTFYSSFNKALSDRGLKTTGSWKDKANRFASYLRRQVKKGRFHSATLSVLHRQHNRYQKFARIGWRSSKSW